MNLEEQTKRLKTLITRKAYREEKKRKEQLARREALEESLKQAQSKVKAAASDVINRDLKEGSSTLSSKPKEKTSIKKSSSDGRKKVTTNPWYKIRRETKIDRFLNLAILLFLIGIFGLTIIAFYF